MELEVWVIESTLHKRVTKTFTQLLKSLNHSTHSVIQLHVISLHSSTINTQKQSYPNHPLFFNASSWPFLKALFLLVVFFSFVLLLIGGPLLHAGCDLCCGGVVAAQCLLQQGSLGCCRQVEEGVDQRQQQQSQQQRDAPLRCHYRLVTASLQKGLIWHDRDE